MWKGDHAEFPTVVNGAALTGICSGVGKTLVPRVSDELCEGRLASTGCAGEEHVKTSPQVRESPLARSPKGVWERALFNTGRFGSGIVFRRRDSPFGRSTRRRHRLGGNHRCR